jgi:hypothetical protein
VTAFWSPAQLDDLSTVGLAVFVAGIFVLALMRGWIVIGRYYRDVVADRDAEIAELRKARGADQITISTLAKALSEKNGSEETVTRLLTAFREAAESRT